MTAWGDLIKAGHSWIHVLQIGGIPYVFTEIEALRVDADAAPGLPSGFDAWAPALMIKEGMQVGVRIDRQTGFAAGDALDLTLSWDGLASGGSQTSDLRLDIFQAPSKITTITADVDATTGSKAVTSTSGWSASHAHIGTERVAVSVVDGTHLNFTARGQSGSRANVYSVRSPTFSRVSDRPLVWRGREVTLWRQLVSPEGRVIDDTWCDSSSTYSRVLWRGYIDAPPKPSTEGMTLRALPLIRRASLPIGHDVQASIYEMMPVDKKDNHDEWSAALYGFPVFAAPGTIQMIWRWEQVNGDVVNGQFEIGLTHPDGVFTLGAFAEAAYSGYTGTSGGIFEGVDASSASDKPLSQPPNVFWNGQQYVIEFRFQTVSSLVEEGGTYVHVPSGGAYFLEPGTYYAQNHSGSGGLLKDGFTSIVLPVLINNFYLPSGYWLPVVQTEGTEWQDVALPVTGFGIIEHGDGKKVIEWDAKIDSFGQWTSPDLTMLRVKTVHKSLGLPRVWSGSTLNYVSGTEGTVKTALLTLLESSGAANRGTYDTLGVGQGCGIHEDQVDEVSLSKPGITDYLMTLYAKGRTSVAELLGGHFALRQMCLVQRCTDPDSTEAGAAISGDCLITLVDAEAPIVDDSSPAISISEAVLEAVEAPEAAEVPNMLELTLSTLLVANEETMTIQDVPRIQAEGPRAHSYTAPGLTAPEALQLAASIIAQGDGQMVLTIRCAPWVEVQPGDAVRLTMAHPMIYDYETATRAPSAVGARCLGWVSSLYDGMQTLTFLLGGATPGAGYLCPSVEILSKPSSTSVTVGAGDLKWLDQASTVLVYTPGQEQSGTPQAVQYTISTISGTTVNFTTSLASWVGAGSVITYPLVADSNARQARFTHNADTYRLS
jgi:hypothetical protein